MGFRQEDTTYRLTFEPGTKLAGLIVQIRSVPIGVMLDLAELVDGDKANMTPAKIRKIGGMFQTLADAIDEWNFEDHDGNPIPPDFDGVRRFSFPNAALLLREWFQAMAGVADPLDVPSTGGSSEQVASIPMDTLSASRAS